MTDTIETYGGDDYIGRPWKYADTADDALRRVLRGIDTHGVEGWEYPEDGYRVIGYLTAALQRVPEILAATDYLIAGAPQEAISAPGADDPETEVPAFYAEIREAQDASRNAVAALGKVHARLGKLKFTYPETTDAAAKA
ncbi:hypothetical protein ACWGDX_02975 [Streptomyces sp. NPDC055025]